MACSESVKDMSSLKEALHYVPILLGKRIAIFIADLHKLSAVSGRPCRAAAF